MDSVAETTTASQSPPEVTPDALRRWLSSLDGAAVVYGDSNDPCSECVVAQYLRASGIPAARVYDNVWEREATGPLEPLTDDVVKLIRVWDLKSGTVGLTAAQALAILDRVTGGTA